MNNKHRPKHQKSRTIFDFQKYILYFYAANLIFAAIMLNNSKSTEELINEELQKQNKSLWWLSQQLSLSISHLSRTLRVSGDKRPLSQSLLNKINAQLQTDFKLQSK